MSWRDVVLRTLTWPGVTAPIALMMRGRASIFMLHRFQLPDLGVAGESPDVVRRALGHLRARGYELLPLREMFERLAGRGPPLRRAVAFTLDDGYVDQAVVGAPIFAEFDCPVTTFVTTGFLDRRVWFWWDQIEYVFRRTARRRFQFPLGEEEMIVAWDTTAQRNAAQAGVTARCKVVTDEEMRTAVAALASAAEVELPHSAPEGYSAMTWDDVRALEDRGMSFGPHTVTHPLLARCRDEHSRHEIVESWSRLSDEARDPVPVFCYPNGQWNDFGPREVATLRGLGMKGAVVGEMGYADVTRFRRDADGPFRVRRFIVPEDLARLVQYVSGVEFCKNRIRGGPV